MTTKERIDSIIATATIGHSYLNSARDDLHNLLLEEIEACAIMASEFDVLDQAARLGIADAIRKRKELL